MVHEAQQRKASILDELTSAKNLLERKIEELRSFEKDYRGRLKGFISEQLEKLEHTAVDPAADQAEVTRRTTHNPDVSHVRRGGAFAPPLRVSAGWALSHFGVFALWLRWRTRILCRTALARHHVIDDEMRIQGWLPRESWPRPSRLSRRPAGP